MRSIALFLIILIHNGSLRAYDTLVVSPRVGKAIGGDGHGGTTPTGLVWAFGLAFAFPIATIQRGTISFLGNNDFEESTPMGLHNSPGVLKQLQSIQFYSNGLPPELKQQLYPND